MRFGKGRIASLRIAWIPSLDIQIKVMLRRYLVPHLSVHKLKAVRYLSSMSSKKINSPHFSKLLTPQLIQLENLFKSAGYEFRFVGGVVRDVILGQKPKDVDIGTDCTPQDMIKIFNEGHIHYIPTGLQHGTLTVQMGGVSYEITTLRADIITDGRHAVVDFVKDWKIDASRRDLTINAMSLSLDGQLYDYFDGERHLAEKKIVFVGDTRTRIMEDYLRILRYFRFYGRIALSADMHDTDTLEAIRELGEGLKGISVERVWSEFQKILLGNHSPSLVVLMHHLGVARHIGLPTSCNFEELERVWSCRKTQKDGKLEGMTRYLQPASLLASLFHSATEFHSLATTWKLSKKERGLGLFLADHRMTGIQEETAIGYFQKFLVDKVDLEWVLELAQYCNKVEYISSLKHWDVPVMPVTGRDLIAARIENGPRLGMVLKLLRVIWVESGYEMGKGELMERVGEVLASVEEEGRAGSDPSKRRKIS